MRASRKILNHVEILDRAMRAGHTYDRTLQPVRDFWAKVGQRWPGKRYSTADEVIQ